MRTVTELRTEDFTVPIGADFQPLRQFTRLYADQRLLSNCIEGADWSSEPVIPIVCEECWAPMCCVSGVAHVLRTDRELIWMPPYFSTLSWPSLDEIYDYYGIRESLLIDGTVWTRFSNRFSFVPAWDAYPRATNHDLIHLWMQERPDYAIPSRYETFQQHLKRSVIASHPLEIESAIAIIDLLDRELSRPSVELAGALVEIDDDWERYNRLYFDADGMPEFVTFESAPPHRLVIAGRYVLQA